MEPASSEIPAFPVLRLYVIECRHEIRCDLSRFFFRHGVGRILFTSLKDVFQRTAVLGRASITKQLDGNGWNGQQKSDQDCSEVAQARYCNATGITFCSSQSWCAALLILRITRSQRTPIASFRRCFQVKRKCALLQHPEREALTNKFGPFDGGLHRSSGRCHFTPVGRSLLIDALFKQGPCSMLSRPDCFRATESGRA
jgi:hypothetical protein